MSEAVEIFFRAWSESDSDKRLKTIDSAVVSDATYADPQTSEPLVGAKAMSDYVSMFVKNAPGASAVVVNNQTQAGMERATIAFRMENGMEQLGQYFVRLNDSGDQITQMVGFVGIGAPE